MNSSLSLRLQKNLYLKIQLKELTELAGRPVSERDLISTNTINNSIDENIKKHQTSTNEFQINFDEKESNRFKKYIENLKKANDSQVYIITPLAKSCGILQIPSISAINLNFTYEINKEGIISFLTKDTQDSLLMDFFQNSKYEKILKIETKGINWPRISY